MHHFSSARIHNKSVHIAIIVRARASAPAMHQVGSLVSQQQVVLIEESDGQMKGAVAAAKGREAAKIQGLKINRLGRFGLILR